jgi:cobalamin synthase
MMSRVICVTQPVQVSVAGISASREPRCLSPRCHVSGESVGRFPLWAISAWGHGFKLYFYFYRKYIYIYKVSAFVFVSRHRKKKYVTGVCSVLRHSHVGPGVGWRGDRGDLLFRIWRISEFWWFSCYLLVFWVAVRQVSATELSGVTGDCCFRF